MVLVRLGTPAAPDVAVSGPRFAVTDQVIHFGLAAIKNVGAAAIESIVKAREQGGPFLQFPEVMWGLSDFDVRHNVVFNYLWNVPRSSRNTGGSRCSCSAVVSLISRWMSTK